VKIIRRRRQYPRRLYSTLAGKRRGNLWDYWKWFKKNNVCLLRGKSRSKKKRNGWRFLSVRDIRTGGLRGGGGPLVSGETCEKVGEELSASGGRALVQSGMVRGEGGGTNIQLTGRGEMACV